MWTTYSWLTGNGDVGSSGETEDINDVFEMCVLLFVQFTWSLIPRYFDFFTRLWKTWDELCPPRRNRRLKTSECNIIIIPSLVSQGFSRKQWPIPYPCMMWRAWSTEFVSFQYLQTEQQVGFLRFRNSCRQQLRISNSSFDLSVGNGTKVISHA